MPSGTSIWTGRSVLVVVAAPSEARAVAAGLGCAAPRGIGEVIDGGEGFSLLQTGVGKVNAASATARALERGGERPIVLNLGICGALPGATGMLPLRSIVIGSEAVYADEGAITPSGFVDMKTLGFPLFSCDTDAKRTCAAITPIASLRDRCAGVLRGSFSAASHLGGIATVSTCSGTDASARDVAARTGAIAEAMEGAAIAHALGPIEGFIEDFLEVRVVSNTTGDRDKQVWDLAGSLETLSQAADALRWA